MYLVLIKFHRGVSPVYNKFVLIYDKFFKCWVPTKQQYLV